AGSLLADLLYAPGALAGAGRLMAARSLLGSAGGAVASLAARSVLGARVPAAPGAPAGAAARLSPGGAPAVPLGLPRLAARLPPARLRLGLALP
ncbi:hypothetical protein C3R44_21675, partial [Mycobacterium tuberculosis]